jgi:hypothetical protein
MNRTLPPGDRGHRGPDSRWASGLAGAMPRLGGLVGGVAAAGRSDGPKTRKARRSRSRAGRGAGEAWLAVERVEPLAIALFRLQLQAHLLTHRPGQESANRVRLPAGGLHGIDKQMHLGRRVSQYISALPTRITHCAVGHSSWRLRIESSVRIASSTATQTAACDICRLAGPAWRFPIRS